MALYNIKLTSSATRALSEKLPPFAAFAAYEFISGPLRENPQRVGAPLRAPFEGYYRARRGEYRVRYRIDDDARIIYVVDVEHRRDVYRS